MLESVLYIREHRFFLTLLMLLLLLHNNGIVAFKSAGSSLCSKEPNRSARGVDTKHKLIFAWQLQKNGFVKKAI